MGPETVLGIQALCSDAGKAWSPVAPRSFLANLSTTLGRKHVKPSCHKALSPEFSILCSQPDPWPL